MPACHIILFQLTDLTLLPVQLRRLEERDVPCLDLPSTAPQPLPVTFEQALAALESLPRLFVEPDGSFVWRVEEGQVDGQLTDGGGQLACVELKGTAPRQIWRQLFDALGLSPDRLLVQWLDHGVYIGATSFLEFQAAP